jgi:4-diphosphocytidyl-2-C-methyl-D-erythritol kinase
MKIFAPAKINLCLDILKKTESGFHEIQTVFQEIPDLTDEIEIEETEKKDEIIINAPVKTEENLAYKALQLIKKTFKIKKFARIVIKKNIPLSSGLGGASSDAAAVLKGLNKLWDLKLSTKNMTELAAQIGADVPFFITGGTALGTHFGEKTTPLPSIKCIKFKINSPKTWPKIPASIGESTKTKNMYESIDLSVCGKNKQKTKDLLDGIKNGDKNAIIKNLHNDFEAILPVKKEQHLSGSGPATFSIIRN